MNRIEIRSEVDGEVIASYADNEGWTVTTRNPEDLDLLWDTLGLELALGERPPKMQGDMELANEFLAQVSRARGSDSVAKAEEARSRGILSVALQLFDTYFKLFGDDEEAADTDQLPDTGLEERRQLAREGRLACAYNVFLECPIPTCGAHEGGNTRSWTLRNRTIIGAPQTP